MFSLNPLGDPDALWQHVVMVLVSGVLGYVIGFAGCKTDVYKLETKLAKLDAELENCLSKKAVKSQEVIVANNESIGKI